MSDNIDYDELDRAVRAASSTRSVKIQTQKTNAAPIRRPVSRGTYMDFAPRRTGTTHHIIRATRTTTVTKPVTPAPKPIAKPVATKPVVKPAPKPVAKPVAAPAARPVVKPVIKPAPKPIAKPVATKPVVKPAPKPVAKPVAAPAARPVAPAKAAQPHPPVAKAQPTTKAPNANNYSLGGRSPFVANTKVEKRPLGRNIPETSASAIRSTHNVYSQKSPTRATENAKKHVVTESTEKKSGWVWALIVVGVIIAGAAIGVLAFTLLFSNKS